MLTRFKLGMLCVCAAMGAAFAHSFLAGGDWTWRAAGIVFAVLGIALPSRCRWRDLESLVKRLVFGLTAGAIGMGAVQGVEALHNNRVDLMIAWFLLALAALVAFLSVRDD